MIQTDQQRRHIEALRAMTNANQAVFISDRENFEESEITINPENCPILDLDDKVFLELTRIDRDNDDTHPENKFTLSLTFQKKPPNEDKIEQPVTVTKTFEEVLDIESSLFSIPVMVSATTLFETNEAQDDFQKGILSAVIAENCTLRIEESEDRDIIVTFTSKLFTQTFEALYPLEDFEKLKK